MNRLWKSILAGLLFATVFALYIVIVGLVGFYIHPIVGIFVLFLIPAVAVHYDLNK